MKFDAELVRYLTKDDYRILTAIEMGMKNHAKVPLNLVQSISGLSTPIHPLIYQLCRQRLVKLHHQGTVAYSLTSLGYDYLALNALVKRGVLEGLGSKIGVGKEADIYSGFTPENELVIVKFHHLGRTSFTDVKNKRDYLQGRQANWLYISRLSAKREYSYLKILAERDFPVPKVYDYNRHVVVMAKAKGTLMQNIANLSDPGLAAARCFALILRLAQLGLIHGDFNEFNLFIDENMNIEVIDFPQIVSVDHLNAKSYFERDVDCIRRFFEARFKFICNFWPKFEDVEIKEKILINEKTNEKIENSEEIEEKTEKIDEKIEIQKLEEIMISAQKIEIDRKRGDFEYNFEIDVDLNRKEEKIEKKNKKNKEKSVKKIKINQNAGELSEKQLKSVKNKVRKGKKK